MSGTKTQSRGSSPKTPSTRRPKLMRAAATEPSVATSNASRKDLAAMHNSRAATLLTRMASYSTQHPQIGCGHYAGANGHRTSTGSICSSPGQSPESALGEKREFYSGVQQCGNYFSFPSFEDFQEYQENEARRVREENDVP